eukprot:2221158-Rhodomonas_salina.3
MAKRIAVCRTKQQANGESLTATNEWVQEKPTHQQNVTVARLERNELSSAFLSEGTKTEYQPCPFRFTLQAAPAPRSGPLFDSAWQRVGQLQHRDFAS